jgi:VCBS repeat-containing protein
VATPRPTTAPTHGALTLNADGSFTYLPAPNYNGPDSFTYRANDGALDSVAAATVSITVTAVNDAPTATAQSVTTNEDTAKIITLTGSDADGNSLAFSVVTGPTHGTLGPIGAPTCTGATPNSCNANVTYTPASNYFGSDSFTFKVNDGTVDSTSATVSITVNAVDDAPTAGP